MQSCTVSVSTECVDQCQSTITVGNCEKYSVYLFCIVIVVLFAKKVRERNDIPFRHLALTIIISFGCYLPVVLFADTIPIMGMLMIPKTCAYVWTVLIGYQAMRNSQKWQFLFLMGKEKGWTDVHPRKGTRIIRSDVLRTDIR